MDVEPKSSRGFRGWAMLALVGLAPFALHARWIDRPFGPHEQNLGCYFGPFAVSFSDFGFGALRGACVYKYRFQPLGEATIYQNHPPAVAWIAAAGGVSERSLRWPFVAAGALSGVVLAQLLRRRVGIAAASGAGLLYALSPAVAFDGVAAYDTFVGLAGLLLIGAFEGAVAAERRRALRWTVVATLSAVGVWLDWTFLWWCVALAALAPTTSWRAWLRTLAVPAIASAGSLVLLFWWRAWSMRAPLLAGPAPQDAAATAAWALSAHGADWPVRLRGMLERLREGFPDATLVAGVVCAPLWAFVGRRLALALLVPALLNAAVFSHHAATHVQFVTWFGMSAAAAVAVVARRSTRVAGRFRRVVVATTYLGLAALAAASASASVAVHDRRASDLFRELGRTADGAAADLSRGFPPQELWAIACNAPFAYAYYVQAPVFVAGATSVAALDALKAAAWPGMKRRLLVLEFARERGDVDVTALNLDPAARATVADKPRTPAPRLLGVVPVGRDGETAVRVVDAYVVDL